MEINDEEVTPEQLLNLLTEVYKKDSLRLLEFKMDNFSWSFSGSIVYPKTYEKRFMIAKTRGKEYPFLGILQGYRCFL